jgi:hypothetical protein
MDNKKIQIIVLYLIAFCFIIKNRKEHFTEVPKFDTSKLKNMGEISKLAKHINDNNGTVKFKTIIDFPNGLAAVDTATFNKDKTGSSAMYATPTGAGMLQIGHPSFNIPGIYLGNLAFNGGSIDNYILSNGTVKTTNTIGCILFNGSNQYNSSKSIPYPRGDFKMHHMNDAADSIYVFPGYKVKLCQHWCRINPGDTAEFKYEGKVVPVRKGKLNNDSATTIQVRYENDTFGYGKEGYNVLEGYVGAKQ